MSGWLRHRAGRMWSRRTATGTLAAVVLSALVLSVAFGYGAAKVDLDMPDGLTWLGDGKRGQVVQVNPNTGQPEVAITVGKPGADLRVAQRGEQLVVTDGSTGEVSFIDLSTLRLSGQRTHSRAVKTLLSASRVYLADLEQGNIYRVDPRTSATLGTPWAAPGGSLSDAAVDGDGQIWALNRAGRLFSLRWNDSGKVEERPADPATITGAGPATVLVAHQTGVTVFSPEAGSVTSVGGADGVRLSTPALRGPIQAADTSPADLVPAAATSASTVVLARPDTVLTVDMRQVDCQRPVKPAVFRGQVYVPCLDSHKVVVLDQDGRRGGTDIELPDGGEPMLVLDDGKLFIYTSNADTGIVIDETGAARPIRIHDPNTPVRDPAQKPAPSPSQSPSPKPAPKPSAPPASLPASIPPPPKTTPPRPVPTPAVTVLPAPATRPPTPSPTVAPTTAPPPPPPPPAEAQPNPASYGQIGSSLSGRCIGVQGGSQADGAAVVQYWVSWDNRCKQTSTTLWGWAGGYRGNSYKIVNYASGKCLDVAGGSTSAGADIVQMPCRDSGGSQLWTWYAQTNNNGWNYGMICNVRSTMCLFLRGESSNEGSPLEQRQGEPWTIALQYRVVEPHNPD
ncbi:hypothetical protein Lfu02_01900 [Longispora fulva]|uniref:Ricin B lectin domain-containing protein n=1 Tax=Longispora fulva TaxID=619741 RepID=A0A8J7GGV9_9ACTN|nr:RICIN domain-containing protein [Longispora fulva]MBG6135938.1 hypothetical protein [Longispora fulva]GIG55818.1 hypothetical protein Lfu02_01900 [Longispora fulva]